MKKQLVLNGCYDMIRQFPASLEYLYEMLSFVCMNGHQAGFHESSMYKIELAVAEALVNIIHYAHRKTKEPIQIECNSSEKMQFSITISDNGTPFNPLNAIKKSDLSALTVNKYEGGYGIFFILKSMDEVSYRNVNGKNILTLVKYIQTK